MSLKYFFFVFCLLSVNCLPLENVTFDSVPAGNDSAEGGITGVVPGEGDGVFYGHSTMCGPDCVWIPPKCRPGYINIYLFLIFFFN